MKPKEYQAAGGVVVDGDGRVLLIERDVVRDGRAIHEVRLPKGHVEPGETDEQAALREVCEETGYADLEIAADLGQSHSSYEHKGRHVERDEHYFLMRLRSKRTVERDLNPKKEESLFKPLWAADLNAAERMLTYEGEKQFAQRAMISG